jgi:hypothetical protein
MSTLPFPKPTRRPERSDSPEPVENYVGVPLPEGLRRRLQTFVNDRPELTLEEACAMLLDLGLRKANEEQARSDADAEHNHGRHKAGGTARRRLLLALLGYGTP